jgi:plasmid stability protein
VSVKVPVQNAEPRALVSAWVPSSLAVRLRERAMAAERSLAAETRVALRRYVEAEEGESASR